MPAEPDSQPAGGPAWRRLLRRRPDGRHGRGGWTGWGGQRGWSAWRLATPLVVIVAGVLAVVSAQSSGGTDLRPGRYRDVGSIVGQERSAVEAQQARAQQLQADVDRLRSSVGGDEIERWDAEIARVQDPAGFTAVSGPGVTVTLADAPQEIQESSERPINDLVVHQQDIQAVVNAMWAAGAEAVTIQGQRVITTTGIKCSGNVVRLHGIPYAQPYRISAVGDVADLELRLASDPYLQIYRQYADAPDVAIGWDVQRETDLDAPAYEDPVDLLYATAKES